MGDVVHLFDDISPVSAFDTLQGAIESDLDMALVIGIDKGGDLFVSSSTADAAFMLLMVELFKKRLLEQPLYRSGDVRP